NSIAKSSVTTVRKYRDTSVQGKGRKPVALIVNSTPQAVPHASVDRRRLIEEAAYHLAEARGFAPGHELDDWLMAEVEVNQRLAAEGLVY
ncbi:MAG: DUF2934 domain-containing protein, partial [Steroidobacter sp.]